MADPQKKNSLLRIIVPVLLLAFGVLIMWSMARNAMRGAPQTPTTAPTTTPAAPQTPPPPTSPPPPVGLAPVTPDPAAPVDADAQAPAPGIGAAPPPAADQPAPIPGLRVRTEAAVAVPDDIGSLDVASGYRMLVRFNPVGAGVESIELTEHFQTVAGQDHDVVQATQTFPVGDQTGMAVPLAAGSVQINGQFVDLSNAHSWRQAAPGAFEATLEDGEGSAVARITRRYRLNTGEYHLVLDQQVENLTDRPMSVRWYQYGPISLVGTVGYGGDTRRVRFGYLHSPATDPTQQYVDATRFILAHSTVAGTPSTQPIWPTARTQRDSMSLVWTATTNRYFAAAVFPLVDPSGATVDKRFHLAQEVHSFNVPSLPSPSESPIILRLTSPETTVQAGGRVDFSHGLYAGPLSRRYTDMSPLTQRLGLGELVVYTFGGPCAFCTFQWLAGGLRGFLGLLHSYLVFDWALAIILLVVCVRTILHPVTRWSQTSMYRFGKQMQNLAPKMKKIQDKYKGEPQKLREETQRLYREENVNFAGALGCIPMFLQMPIWIALFAMLYFAFDLRHEPAFFGVFQAITGGRWHFLSDLAEPDHILPFGVSIHVPLLSTFMGPIQGLNILPFALGAVFYMQQKYLTPPTTMTLTPEQQAQQKMIKVMMVVMFPVIMYNAPSGLAIYFITNSALGILESRHIRHKAEKADAEREARIAAGLERPAARKERSDRPGFLQRLQQYAEKRQKMIEQMKTEQARRQQRGGGGGGGGGKGRR